MPLTRRERAERRLERRREWAATRAAKAAAGFRVGDEHRDATGRMDWALVTQPGHIPERARIIRAHDRAIEDYRAAENHRSKAAGIAQQLDRTIFSDDADAPERLAEKADALDATADRMKTVNAAYRKAKGADPAAKLAVLVDAGTITKDEALKVARLWSMSCGEMLQPYPAYQLSLTRANARRCRERIKVIEERARRAAAADDAGGCVIERFGEEQEHARVTFAEFPGREIINALKSANFWWSAPSWHGRSENLPAAVLAMAERHEAPE